MNSAKLRNACGASVVALLLSAVAAHASVEISSGATSNMSCSAGVCSPIAKKAVLNVTDLANMLTSGDVAVKSNNLAEDIAINAAVSWTSASRLTLDSYRSITFNKPLVVAGTGALTITTNDGGTGGDFRFFGKGHAEFWDTDSSLTINGHNYLLVASIKKLKGLLNHKSNGFYALMKSDNLKKEYIRSPIGELQGTLEGLGNNVSNLTITSSVNEDGVALIGRLAEVASSATVRDIHLKNVKVTGSGIECVGSLVAVSSFGTILNSSAAGTVTATNMQSGAGGLVCANLTGVVRNSSSQVQVTGAGANPIGGLVGINDGVCGPGCAGSIDQSFATGSVTGSGDGLIGGLVGQNLGGSITNSYATGSATGAGSSFVGGLIGSNENNDDGQSDPVVMNSYSIGAVSGGSGATTGGLIGQDTATPGITHAYWDLDTSGVSDPHRGAGNIADDPGITGLTDAQLQSGLAAGFDSAIWEQKSNINNGYPYLIANRPPQ